MKSIRPYIIVACLLFIGWFLITPAIGWYCESRDIGPWWSPEVWSITGADDPFSEVPTIPGPDDDVFVNHALVLDSGPVYIKSLTIGPEGRISSIGSDLEIWTTEGIVISPGGCIESYSDPNTGAGGALILVSGESITIQTSGENTTIIADRQVKLEGHEGIDLSGVSTTCVISQTGPVILQVPSEEFLSIPESIPFGDIIEPEPYIDWVMVIDDFEDYTNFEGEDANWIWETWFDGYYDPNNGSTVGHEANYMESEIVFSGRQSMPFFYNNIEGVTESVAYRIWDEPQDWSEYDTWSQWIHGDPNNTGGQFFVQINDQKEYPDVDLTKAEWRAINGVYKSIDGGVSWSMFNIGVEGEGAIGIIYIDDIVLNK